MSAATYEKAPNTPAPMSASSSYFLKGDIDVQSPVGDVRFQDEKRFEEPQEIKVIPTRKYSVEWCKATWNDAVRTGTRARIAYCGIGLVFMAVWIGIMLSLVQQQVDHEKGLRSVEYHRNQEHTQGNQDNSYYTVQLEGSLVNFKEETRTLTVSWSGLSSPNFTANPVELGNSSNPDSLWYPEGIEIYRDISAHPYNLTFTDPEYNNETYWWVSWKTDNETAKPIGVIGVHTWDSFDTDITLTQRYAKDAWRQPSLGYPFDQWEGSIVFVANDREFANYSNSSHGAVFGLSAVQLKDATLNWQFDYKFIDHCYYNESTVIYENISTYPQNCHMEVNFYGSRPPLLIFCAVAAVAVNWTCAIFIFILTSEAIIMRRSYMLQGTDILSMCFTALFALPTIRSLLPGAPAYGAIIDLVGILPCTLIVALCAVCVAVAKLNKRHKFQQKAE